MRKPRPDCAAISSAATTVAQDEPSPIRTPTMMKGVEAGTTTRRKMVKSEAPSTRAASMKVRSTPITPW